MAEIETKPPKSRNQRRMNEPLQDLFQRIKKIEDLLPEAWGAERFKLQREIYRVKRLAKQKTGEKRAEKSLVSLEGRVRASVDKRARREENKPRVTFDENLPIAAKRDEIAKAIRENPVVIVSGETGSGKTTQIPKICLEAGRGVDGLIGCTQPRRIAAVTVAARIAEELGEDLGQSVGYKIRFDEKTGRDGYIKIMTDGVLLAEAQTDPFLNEYDVLIVDEAHERSLNIDFALGILQNLLSRRKNLKLIVTSATIDTEKFSKAFNDAPVVEVSGRTYPVDVKYWPPEEFSADEEITHVEMAVEAVDRLQRRGPFGDILVFMPTEQDIRETCEIIEGRKFKGAQVFPLFARLSSGEQRRVFSSFPGRKIIVATNVAETSITIPGIRYVVDTGLARILRYSPRTRTTALPVEPVSRSSADQRMGRCGRVEKGVCVRLYSQEDYEDRPLYTPPEILRSNLAEVVLRMIALNLGDVGSFPFIDKPEQKSISDGFDLLKELGAIREANIKEKKRTRGKYVLTQMGRFMAALPLDPRISRILIEAKNHGVLADMLVVAAALSIRDPRERPADKADEADRKQARFADPMSDFASMLNLWNAYRLVWKENRSAGALKRFCKEHFLSFKRMREWRDIRHQLESILEESKVEIGELVERQEDEKSEGAFGPVYERIHRSVLAGFLSGIAQKKEKNIFRAAKNREVMIFPGSGLFNRAGEWIVAAEMVETSRLFARTCAAIDVGWLEEAGGDLCRRSWSDPRWDRKRGEVTASEQVSLFGLVIVASRTVSYGKINPVEASDVFIRSALAEGDLDQKFGFYEHNLELIEQVRDLENRMRKRDLLVGDEHLYRFYKSRLGDDVSDIRALKNRMRKAGGDGFLRMQKKDLLNYEPDSDLFFRFPDRLDLGDSQFACLYRFEPGDEKDGLTVQVPAAVASSLADAPIDWHVPGLLEEKIVFLLKGLPKKYRRELVPVADTAGIIVREMPRSDVPLLTALSRFVHERFHVDIPASRWPYDDLPDHLKMRISVVDSKGRTVRSGRGRDVLSGGFRPETDTAEVAAVRKKWERTGISEWDFGDLSDSIEIKGRGGGRWMLHPALVADPDGNIALRLFANRDEAVDKHGKGVLALYKKQLAGELKFLRKTVSLGPEAQKYAALFGGAKDVERDLVESVWRDFFQVNIREKKTFLEHAQTASGRLAEAALKKKTAAVDVLKAVAETRDILFGLEASERKNPAALELCQMIRNSLANLIPENFLELYGDDRLLHLPRYAQALAIRAQRGAHSMEKDAQKAASLKRFGDELRVMLEGLGPEASSEKRGAVEDFFWLLEEFRVSLFAQELKTVVPVSEKRLQRKIDEIRRMV